MSIFKTGLLLAGLTALFMGVGYLIGGTGGMAIAFVIAAGLNLFSYWNADRIVLRMYRAVEVDARTAPEYYATVERLARNAGLPMPRVYLIDNPQPNAFATGRNPQNSAVAATTGLLRMLSPEEVAGVVAHELAHVKNRDTLIMTVTATIAGAISMLANFAFFFGGNRENNNPLGIVGVIVAAIVAPLAAALVQFAISRTREYAADRAGAEISSDPRGLASALARISEGAARIPNVDAERSPATAHLFIVNPLSGQRMDNLFSTHPATENRIAALMALDAEMAGRLRAGSSASRSGFAPSGPGASGGPRPGSSAGFGRPSTPPRIGGSPAGAAGPRPDPWGAPPPAGSGGDRGPWG